MPTVNNGPVGAKTAGRRANKSAKFKILDAIIFSVICLAFFLTPIFFTGLTAQGLGFEKMVLLFVLILLGVVAWVTKGVVAGELPLKRTPLDLPILALLATYIISTALSISRKDSILGYYGSSSKGLVAFVIFVLFYYFLVNNLTLARLKKLYLFFLSAISLLIVFSFLQLQKIFILPWALTKNISFNPFGSLSALTMGLVVALPLLVVGAAQAQEMFPRWRRSLAIGFLKLIFLLITLADLSVLFLLSGFTYWPAAIVGIVIVLMFFLSRVVKITNNNLVIPIVIFIILVIFFVFGNISLFNLPLPAEVSLSRSASFNIAKTSLKHDPFFGSGPSTFFYDFTRYKQPAFNMTPLWNIRFDSASGYLFELIATIGSIGFLALVVIILIALSLGFIALIKTKETETRSILLGAYAAFVTSLLFLGLFSLNNSILIFIVLASLLALVAAIIVYPERFMTLNLSFRASPKYALALSAIFLSVIAGVAVFLTMGVKLYMADVYAKQALAAGRPEKKVEFLQKAINLAPQQDSYYISLANQYMALANRTALQPGADQTKIQRYLSLAINAGQKAISISPNNAADNEALALIYENASFYTRGALEWAERLYKKVIELDPNNPTPYLRIALVNMARANAETDQAEKKYYIQEAIKKYDEALDKKNDLAAAYYGKAIAYEKLGEIDKAIEQMKTAAVLARNNADYLFELGRFYFNRGVAKQPNLSQQATKKIAEESIKPKEGTTTPAQELSVTPTPTAKKTIAKNKDLATAESLFQAILRQNPNYANSLYSLALLYQKVGQNEKASIYVKRLLKILKNSKQRQAVEAQFKGLY